MDNNFPIPLSQKISLEELAQKFLEKGTLCVKIENGEIISMLAGYTQNVINNMAYVSVDATIPNAQGKGYMSVLIMEFISYAAALGLDGVHLYTGRENIGAIHMYEKLGFVDYVIEPELRPEDRHFVYWIK